MGPQSEDSEFEDSLNSTESSSNGEFPENVSSKNLLDSPPQTSTKVDENDVMWSVTRVASIQNVENGFGENGEHGLVVCQVTFVLLLEFWLLI